MTANDVHWVGPQCCTVLQVDVSPYVHIDVSGASRVGASLYSEVDLSGVLVEGATPSSLQQDWSRWPLTAR